jgi:hypothetical protein
MEETQLASLILSTYIVGTFLYSTGMPFAASWLISLAQFWAWWSRTRSSACPCLPLRCDTLSLSLDHMGGSGHL